MRQEFNERLKELTEGKSKHKLSKNLGFGESAIDGWCLGFRSPKLSYFIRLADYFNCSLDFLYGRSEDDTPPKPAPMPKLDERIKSVLKACGVTWYNVVKNTGLSKSTLLQWGRGRDPLLSKLAELADYLGVSIDYLVGREL